MTPFPRFVSSQSWTVWLAIVATVMMVLIQDRSSIAQEVRYNRDVLPILAENCFTCHGFDKTKREAGLRLDSEKGALATLESGSRAIIPGKTGQSALIQRIFTKDTDLLMPPKESGKQLTADQQETLRRWVKQGARYEAHWAFIPPKYQEPPKVTGVDHAIDRFIQTRLAQEKITPSPEANRSTLIRRLSLDLIGLPPSPLEVDAFVNDRRTDAYERVVDRLLASEHFGERWARWWLDLAHYGDSDGYLQDFLRPVAWRYRQWVVDAFNRDMPFDQFTIEQLAGDLFPNATVSQRTATGFLRNTLSNREGGAGLEEFRVRQVIDRTSTVSTIWLALTFACAECHDHKFDAISQREFYQFYDFFNNADEANFNAPLPGELKPWLKAKQVYDQKRAKRLAPISEALATLQADWEKQILHAEAHPGDDFSWDRKLELLGLQWGQNLGEGQLEGLNIIKTPLAQRTQDQQDRLIDYFLDNIPSVYNAKAKELKLSEVRAQIKTWKNELPKLTRAPGMMQSVIPRATHIHIRGNYRRHGDKVKADTPAALPRLNTHNSQPDRLALARWLVSPEHPLTARVTVNRLWQELFGRGIVATSENFGVRGDRPSHPELLDWLALKFQQRNWSTKELLRVIVTSQTYKQSSRARPELTTLDPDNELLARQSRLRLSAEMVRDSILKVSGLLSHTIGGPSVKPQQPDSVSKAGYSNEWKVSSGADRYRRGLYTFIQRTSPFAQFVTFDLPDTSSSCTRRERSNTPLQALNLLNDPVFLEAARSLTSHVIRESSSSNQSRLNRAYMLVLARPPQPAESKRLLKYLEQQKTLFNNEPSSLRELLLESTPQGDPVEYAAWIALSSVLLNLDETITRE
ncbi:PSD1 and planctomycete cytochrome C domain-containing protein [Gimesia aquarii]|uniref:Planctomycete cytochrome C n=1 Tax=Gimesia aquarii TaxID=2527964 RepID=A0A517VVV6_9PLAN|nr:PSD1 and planctomycete cytochrome C domain-containing protein [Gimesia aquarii]QDT97138.1 Planctomycete cytochrome C [Gimesia aquarii]